MRFVRNCTPPFTKPFVPSSFHFRFSSKFANCRVVARKSFSACGFTSDPATNAPFSMRQVLMVSPSQPVKVLPSKSGVSAA